MEHRPEATYGDLFAFLRRHLLFAVLVAAVAALTTYFLSVQLRPTFEAQARLLVAQPSPELRNFGGIVVQPALVDPTVYREAAMTDGVLVDALDRLGVEAPSNTQVADFRERVDVRIEQTTVSSIVQIRARSGDAVAAADEANALAAALTAWDTRRAATSVRRIVDTLENQIVGLDEQISILRAQGASQAIIDEQLALREAQRQQLALARAQQTSAIGLIEPFELALPPLEPAAPRPLRTAALVGVVGLLLGYALMLLRGSFDRRLTSPEDLRRLTGLNVLAEFRSLTEGSSRVAREATSYLRTNLGYALPEGGPTVVVVTGVDRGTATLPVSMSLAESYARNGQRTVLVDSDLRKSMPRAALAEEYDLLSLGQPSLREHLEHPDRPVNPTEIDLGGGYALGFVASFHPAPYPSELLSRAFGPLLARLQDRYDVVVVDAAPVLAVADALAVAPHADGVVLVVDLAAADRGRVAHAVETLEPIRPRVLGVVAVNVPRDRLRSGAGGTRDDARDEARERPAARGRKPRQEPVPARRPLVGGRAEVKGR